MKIANIDPAAVISQNEKENVEETRSTVTYDKKNYLNTRLEPQELQKVIRVRLLPFDTESGTPFHKVFMHTIKVDKELSSSGWRSFVCPSKNGHNKPCPFCETAAKAREMHDSATTQAERDNYWKIECDNKVRDTWIVRCIDRDHEEDGVKFWMFNSSRKKDGVYDKIINLFNQRWTSAQAKGKVNNIFDLQEGKDLIITIQRDSVGKTVMQITDDDEKSPLASTIEQMEAWVNDPKKWTDVYSEKSYEYLSIIVEGGIPYYNKDTQSWMDKSAMKEMADKSVEEALTKEPAIDVTAVPSQVGNVDVSKIVTELRGEAKANASSVSTTTLPPTAVANTPVITPTVATPVEGGDEELPF